MLDNFAIPIKALTSRSEIVMYRKNLSSAIIERSCRLLKITRQAKNQSPSRRHRWRRKRLRYERNILSPPLQLLFTFCAGNKQICLLQKNVIPVKSAKFQFVSPVPNLGISATPSFRIFFPSWVQSLPKLCLGKTPPCDVLQRHFIKFAFVELSLKPWSFGLTVDIQGVT